MSEGSFWPTTWREALPLLVWGVVIFASGFEGVASLLHGEWLQAFLGLGGMLGLTAMLIHWTRLKDNFSDVRWLMAAIMVALIVAALSPYVEQRRWPFSTVMHDPPTAKDIATAIASIQFQLDAAIKGQGELQRENDRLRHLLSQQPTGPSAQEPSVAEGGPINWRTDNQFLVTSGGGPQSQIHSVILQGTSTTTVTIKDAYAISELTGHKQELMANVQYKGYYPVDKVDIPPQAAVWLELLFKPPLSIREFQEQWGKFHVTIIYNSVTYERDFTEAYVQQKLRQIFPDAFGPHITSRDNK